MTDGEGYGGEETGPAIGDEVAPDLPPLPQPLRRRTPRQAAEWVVAELTGYHDMLAGAGTPVGDRRAQGLAPGIAAARRELLRLAQDPSASDDTKPTIDRMLAALPQPSGDEDVDLGLQYAVATIKTCATEAPPP